MRNIEIKAKVKELSKLLEKARSISNSNGEIINQNDTIYRVENGRLKLRRFENGNAELIHYDRPDIEGPKLSSYAKAHIEAKSVADLNDVLSRALGNAGVVKKERHLFRVDQTRVHVDSVEGLGDFMELEVVLKDDQNVEDGEKIAVELMEKLGVQKEDLVSGAYTDLLNKR